MPLAGREASRRVAAHIRWADRYHTEGNASKAAAHFGRAVHYARVGFGPADNDAASFVMPTTVEVDHAEFDC
jgi:hypothetical protein